MLSLAKKITKKENTNPEVLDSADKIVVVDVGCRWGFAERFFNEQCLSSFKIFGFDPDAEECLTLQSAYNHLPDGYITCVPVGLAGGAGLRNQYLTSEPACSSLHPPRQFLSENYPALDYIELKKVVTVFVTALYTWARETNLNSIAYLKLDTQGSELEILQGGSSIVPTARCIDIEVEFNPIYEGQSLFGETGSYLRSQGFVLLRLSNLVHYSLGGERLPMPDKNYVCFDTNVRQEVEAFGGQLFWVDARYVHKDVLVGRSLQSMQYLNDIKLFNALGMLDVVAHVRRIARLQ